MNRLLATFIIALAIGVAMNATPQKASAGIGCIPNPTWEEAAVMLLTEDPCSEAVGSLSISGKDFDGRRHSQLLTGPDGEANWNVVFGVNTKDFIESPLVKSIADGKRIYVSIEVVAPNRRFDGLMSQQLYLRYENVRFYSAIEEFQVWWDSAGNPFVHIKLVPTEVWWGNRLIATLY